MTNPEVPHAAKPSRRFISPHERGRARSPDTTNMKAMLMSEAEQDLGTVWAPSALDCKRFLQFVGRWWESGVKYAKTNNILSL